MADISELKEMIVDLKMQLVKTQIPKGCCPYTYSAELAKHMKGCTMDCDKCRERFMVAMRKKIIKEVENL